MKKETEENVFQEMASNFTYPLILEFPTVKSYCIYDKLDRCLQSYLRFRLGF